MHRFGTSVHLVFVFTASLLVGCGPKPPPCPKPPVVETAGKSDYFVGNLSEAIEKNRIGDEEKAKATALFENADHTVNIIQTRTTVAPHHHAEHDEFVMIVDGKVTFSIEGEAREVQAGDVIIIPRGAVHSFESAENVVTTAFSMFSPKFDPSDRIKAEPKP